jgi:7-carboxy-7-deazaguanine synthase
MKLQVNEIFSSIQGESSFAGRPCTFIRLTGCNLRCSYCDTRYALHEGRWMTVVGIQRVVKSLGNPLVEVTGGEPLLQKTSKDLLRALVRDGFQVLVETNGSLDIGGLPGETFCILDMKCPSSGMTGQMLPENIERLREQDEVKFVLSTHEDYTWARGFLNRLSKVSPGRILFSPVRNGLPPAQLAEWILSDRLAVRLQIPLHAILWPENQRGR